MNHPAVVRALADFEGKLLTAAGENVLQIAKRFEVDAETFKQQDE